MTESSRLLPHDAPEQGVHSAATDDPAIATAEAQDTLAPSAPGWPDRLLRWLVLLTCGLILSKSHADPDFWGHVQYGRDALAHGLPTTSTYTYTAEGHPWVNHEILAELTFALGVDWFGPAGLLALKCLAGMGLAWLVIRRAEREGVGILGAYSGALWMSGVLMLFWTLRPQLFSFGYFVALILLLDHVFADWRPEDARSFARRLWRLWPVGPLAAAWANTHGGFLAGLAVLTAYLGVRSLEAVWRMGWRLSAPFWVRAAFVVVFAGAATLVNPYGLEYHRWLFDSLTLPRPEIIEWRSPDLHVAWLPFWLLAIGLPAMVFLSERRLDLAHATVLAAVLWQACEHRRHMAFFAILFGMWCLPHWDAALRALKVGLDRRSLSDRFAGPLGVVVSLALLFPIGLLTMGLSQRSREIPVRHDSFPVEAFSFIGRERLEGRLVTKLKWAQYAIAAFAAEGRGGMRLQFDGRYDTCYPWPVIDSYFDFAEGERAPFRARNPVSPPPDASRVLRDGAPDLVLIERADPTPGRVMREHAAEWVLLYQDGLAQLWGRRDRYDNPSLADFFPAARRAITERDQSLRTTAWPALPPLGGERTTTVVRRASTATP